MENRSILIVEDEVHVALLLSRALEQPYYHGHQIDICPRAEVALRKLEKRQYDLVVTDLYLSGTSGIELIRHVRQKYPRTRTLLITGWGSYDIQEVTRRLGSEYLPKPFSTDEFASAVERILEEQAQEDARERQPR